MKILTISNYFPEHAGGIEFVAFNLVKRWRQRHEVVWMACNVKDRPHVAAPDDISMPAFNFTEEQLGFPYPIPGGKSVFEIFEQVQRCDVVHIHDSLYVASLIAFLASRQYRKPLLVTQHVGIVPYAETYKNILQRIAYRTFGRYVLGHAERVVFISERVKKWFEGRVLFRHPPSLIPNGVDHEVFYPPTPAERNAIRSQLGYSKNDIVLLFAGRFAQKKGLNLIRDIARMRPNYQWLMIGSGETDPRAWNASNIKTVESQPQTELRNYYAAADLLVLPSRGEGFPLAVQEALSCGLPAAVSHEVATFHPNAPLLDLDVSMPETILPILDNFSNKQHLTLEMKNDAVEYAKQWEWNNVAEKYEILITEIAQTLHSSREK
jgi:glycosyltransferase involved in cell wall biosynthesis